uniref:Dolichyl-diphosphooligosaccharide--protein glycosyltransferase 48 kDa subunit n=1 Tax=Hyaloperonospora arabidopsidis (strain Emoy2) TaxID=559515 RepID=M4BUK7_HYAAE
MTWRSLLLGLCVTLTLVATQAARTAVVLESLELQKTHSKFFKLLEARGHQLDFFTSEEQEKEQPLELERYGERTYDNLVLFTPQKALGTLRKSDLLHFVEEGGNVLLSSSKKLTKVQRDFALECGIEFEKRGNVVLDHVNPIPDDGDIYNSVIAAEDFVASERVVGSLALKPKPVAFSGMGMSLEPNNVLAFHALMAPVSAYSANPVKPITDKIVSNDLLFGNQIGLVTAVQGRNNARLVFAGSLDLFSDKFFDNEMFANAEFADTVTKWAFQESGVLRMTNVKHHREDGSLPAKMLSDAHRGDQPITLYPDAEVARDSLVYRVKDNLTYSFDMHELKSGKWVPYRANDVQLEFVMLDPHVRTTMVHDNNAHFHVTFQAPDVYGIFLFRVLYRRLGLSTVYTTTQVSLRPFKHDEYERFIPAAYPYYASAFSMMAGVFLFSVYFLFHEGKK